MAMTTATAADLKVGDVFTLADERSTSPLYIEDKAYAPNHGLTVRRIEVTDTESRRIFFERDDDELSGDDKAFSDIRNYGKVFFNSHSVKIVTPGETATAADLKVGDVFTLADEPKTRPLHISGNNYAAGCELVVLAVDLYPGNDEARQIKFDVVGNTSPGQGGELWSNIIGSGKYFANSHPVTIVRKADAAAELTAELGDMVDEMKDKSIASLRVQLAEAQALADSRQGVIEDQRRQIEDQRSRLDKHDRDWRTINVQLNEYADSVSWCPEYEEHLENFNGLITSYQFIGREQDYEVTVRLTSTFVGSLTVRASSADAARDHVHGMGTGDVYSEAGFGSEYRRSEDDDYDIDEIELSS